MGSTILFSDFLISLSLCHFLTDVCSCFARTAPLFHVNHMLVCVLFCSVSVFPVLRCRCLFHLLAAHSGSFSTRAPTGEPSDC
ncbi:hypothetical protein V8C43DRAFT_281852 [Trichoderma afarasin]